jgi:hypothetical protein
LEARRQGKSRSRETTTKKLRTILHSYHRDAIASTTTHIGPLLIIRSHDVVKIHQLQVVVLPHNAESAGLAV